MAIGLALSHFRFFVVLQRFRPEYSEAEVEEVLDAIDEKGDGVIDSYEWTVGLFDALTIVFDKVSSCVPV